MDTYTWTLTRGSASHEGMGTIEALKHALGKAHLDGVNPLDWTVDLLLADGFEDGQAIYRHEASDPHHHWNLVLRPNGKR